MKRALLLLAVPLAAAASLDSARGEQEKPAETFARGPDQPYWLPTLEQALEMSRATGRHLFLMGYSLVGDGSTYTKVSDEFCKGVF